jgi:hypothetical protein
MPQRQMHYTAPIQARQALNNMRRRLRDPRTAELTARELQSLDCELFLQEYAAAYRELRTDPEAWKAEQAEARSWDGTLMDGLEREDAPGKAKCGSSILSPRPGDRAKSRTG